ncbi:hypothetical protein G3I19_03955 [Streptomyces sp. SID10853]|uniref:hypothetical protein n=1 Tax=Streptomyces sp. SID10853 TaxID=2706028 RepID=UPI0013C06CB7|nr:hypothetical protein [Streptomyces sp. SID10853]NDZ77693.1 hypothetical protein [Streptomyces sp. SID10853]
MTREKGRAAAPDGTDHPEAPGKPGSPGGAAGTQEGPRPPRRITAATLDLFRGNWRGLYGFSFGVTLFAALVGAALVAAAFALSWHNFAVTWKQARDEIAYEDPPFGYFAEQYTSIVLRSLPFMGLLLVFAVLVLAVLLVANAVAVRDTAAGGPALRPGDLWRRSRPYIWRGFRVQLLTLVCVAPLALLAYLVAAFFRSGGMMGIEIPRLDYWSSTPYRLLGNSMTSLVIAAGVFVWLRLNLATAAAVNDAPTARAALARSWKLTRGARRWRALSVCVLLAAVVTAAFALLSHAAGPVAHTVGLAVLWLTHDNPYAAGAVMEVVPTAVGLLVLAALVVPPVATAHALLRTELRPAADPAGH